MRARRLVLAAALVAAVAAVVLLAVGSGPPPEESGAGDVEPARLEHVRGTDLSRVMLSAGAAERLGIKTAPVAADGGRGTVIPYDAVLYNPDGSTFTYTSPEPHVFLRSPIRVRDIRGDRALLSAGPPAGTAVVTVGSQELFGVEYEVEED